MFSTESKTKRNECQSRYYQRKLPMLSLFGVFLKKDIFEPGWSRLITVMASCYYWWAGSGDFGKLHFRLKRLNVWRHGQARQNQRVLFFHENKWMPGNRDFNSSLITNSIKNGTNFPLVPRILTLISSFLFHKIKGVVLIAKILLALKIKWF